MEVSVWSPKSHCQEAAPVDLSVNWTFKGSTPLVLSASKAATGGALALKFAECAFFAASIYFLSLLLGSAEGHEYPDLQVGDEVDPRLFLIPIKIYNIDPL